GGLSDRDDIVIGVVQAGPDQVVHGRVDDHKFATDPLLDVDHARDQQAGIADDAAPWFDFYFRAQGHDEFVHELRIVLEVDGRLAAIGDADAATKVDALDGQPRLAQGLRQFRDLREGRAIGRDVGQLRADVDREAQDPDALHARRGGIELRGV